MHRRVVAIVGWSCNSIFSGRRVRRLRQVGRIFPRMLLAVCRVVAADLI